MVKKLQLITFLLFLAGGQLPFFHATGLSRPPRSPEKPRAGYVPKSLKKYFNQDVINFLEKVLGGTYQRSIFKNETSTGGIEHTIIEKLDGLLGQLNSLAHSFSMRNLPDSGGMFGQQADELPFMKYEERSFKKENLQIFWDHFLPKYQRKLRERLGAKVDIGPQKKTDLTSAVGGYVDSLLKKEVELHFIFYAEQLQKLQEKIENLLQEVELLQEEKKELKERIKKNNRSYRQEIKKLNIRLNLYEQREKEYRERIAGILTDYLDEDAGFLDFAEVVELLNRKIEGERQTSEEQLRRAKKKIKQLEKQLAQQKFDTTPENNRFSSGSGALLEKPKKKSEEEGGFFSWLWKKRKEKKNELAAAKRDEKKLKDTIRNDLRYVIERENYRVGYKRGKIRGLVIGFFSCLIFTLYSERYVNIRDYLLGKLAHRALLLYEIAKKKTLNFVKSKIGKKEKTEKKEEEKKEEEKKQEAVK